MRPKAALGCHRWEYDKNPELFFAALTRLHAEGRSFRVVLTGQRFREIPAAFEAIGGLGGLGGLGGHVVHAGFVKDRAAYLRHIAACDLVVSTAIGENFGIAVVEAMLAGCQPLLPNRLAYPEIVPARFHEACLFAPDSRLYESLLAALAPDRRLSRDERRELALLQRDRFGADTAVAAIDTALDRVAKRCG